MTLGHGARRITYGAPVTVPKTQGQTQLLAIQLVKGLKKKGPMFLKTTTSFEGDRDKKSLSCSMSIGRVNHRKKLHGSEMRTCGYSNIRSESLCNNNALWSSQYQVGESVTIRHIITLHKRHVSATWHKVAYVEAYIEKKASPCWKIVDKCRDFQW